MWGNEGRKGERKDKEGREKEGVREREMSKKAKMERVREKAK